MPTYHAAIWIRDRDGREHAIHFIGTSPAPHRLVRWLLSELTRRGYTIRASEWRSGERDGAYSYRSTVADLDLDDIPW